MAEKKYDASSISILEGLEANVPACISEVSEQRG